MRTAGREENKKFWSRYYTEVSVERMHPMSDKKSSLDQLSCFLSFIGVRYCIGVVLGHFLANDKTRALSDGNTLPGTVMMEPRCGGRGCCTIEPKLIHTSGRSRSRSFES